MKKIIIAALISVCMVCGAFAATNELSVSFAIPAQISTMESSTTVLGQTTKVTATNTTLGYGVNATDTIWISREAGLRFSLDAYNLSTMDTNTVTKLNDVKQTDMTSTVKFGEVYDKAMQFSLFGGAALKVWSSKYSTLVVAPGIDYTYEQLKAKNSSTTTINTRLGAGADVALNLSLGNGTFITLGCPVIWVFSERIDDKKNGDFKGCLKTAAKIGIGAKL